MRILMLTPRFPYPPDRGDTVRSWSILEGLTRRHEVWLACVDRRPPVAVHLDRVRARCRAVEVVPRSGLLSLWRGGWSVLAGRSLTEGYFCDARLAATLRAWSAEADFDAIFTYSSSIAPLAAEVQARRRVLDLCDVDSLKWETYARRSVAPLRWFYRNEAWRVAELERHAVRQHDICILVNERERQKLIERIPGVHAGVLPTAVPTHDYAPPTDELPREPVVGMLGSMFYPPNVRAVHWFGRHVWPAVQQQVPQARWLIVGGRPVRSVRQWGRRPGVEVTGYVPDVCPYLHAMRVVVNAIDNDLGVQSKLVVAMAAGRPAVVTPHAAAGLVYDDPPPFIVSSTPSAFAEAVVRLLRDDAQARALAARARAVARENYDAARAVQRVEAWLSGERSPASHAARGGLAAAAAGPHEVVAFD